MNLLCHIGLREVTLILAKFYATDSCMGYSTHLLHKLLNLFLHKLLNWFLHGLLN